MGLSFFPISETAIINTIGKAYDELAILELDLRRIALVRQVRQLCPDMSVGNCLDRLAEGHV